MLLLKFPYLIQIQIIRNLELYEYFFLGLCSKKTRKMLRNSGVVKYDNAVIHTIYSTLQVQNFACHGQNVVMYSAKNDRKNMHLRHEIPFWSGQIRLWYRDSVIRCRISTHPTLQIPILWCKSKHKTLLPMALHYYICEVFHLFTDIQICSSRFSHLPDFPDTLEVDNLHECGKKSEIFFEKINIRNGLGLSEDDALLNTGHKNWSVKHLWIGYSTRITVDHLFAFRGSTAVFEWADRISNQDLVKFIDNWLNSDNRKLEAMMIMKSIADTRIFDKDSVLGHFDSKPWDPKRRAGRFLYPDGWRVLDRDDPADSTNGMDIERKSDGMLATVIIKPRQFKFFVWHQRFPDPDKNKPMVKPPVMLLLKFPYLIQVEIIRNLELYDYFFLGLCSKKTRKMLRNSGVVKYDNAVIHTIHSTLQVQKFACPGQNVVMYSARSDRKNMHLRHEIPFWSGQIRLWYRDTVIRCRISTHPDLQIPILWCESKHRTLLPMALHSYICKIFHLFTEVQILFRISHLSDFPDTLEVDNLQEWASKPSENPESFLEKINIRNGLNLADDDLVLNTDLRVWSVDHLCIRTAAKINVNHLLAFRGSTAVFRTVYHVFSQDLVKFIENWLNSDNRKLEAIMIEKCMSGLTPFDKDSVLAHFDSKPWDPKRRDGRFLYPDGWIVIDVDDPADCTNGMDIERKSDGMLATVIITPRRFKFFVWHQRFPDPDKNKPMVKPPMVKPPMVVQKWMIVGSILF